MSNPTGDALRANALPACPGGATERPWAVGVNGRSIIKEAPGLADGYDPPLNDSLRLTPPVAAGSERDDG